MYDAIETGLSKEHLIEVLKAVDEPIVLMGGWAVFCHVNEGYERTTGRLYVGSRDIDLGFHIPHLDTESSFDVSFQKLVDDLGFRPITSSRLLKEIDRETGDVLSPEKAKTMQMYEIFQMYVDLIVDSIPVGFKNKYSFVPIDEPLLQNIFQDPQKRTEQKLGGRPVWLPAPNVLISMKMKSYPQRDKEHKRLKDISDIVALFLFCEATPSELRSEDIARFRNALDRREFKLVSSFTGLSPDIIEGAIQSVSRMQ
jgi:hypothetical protein